MPGIAVFSPFFFVITDTYMVLIWFKTDYSRAVFAQAAILFRIFLPALMGFHRHTLGLCYRHDIEFMLCPAKQADKDDEIRKGAGYHIKNATFTNITELQHSF